MIGVVCSNTQFPTMLGFASSGNVVFRRLALKGMLCVHGPVEAPPMILLTNIRQYLEVRTLW